MFIVPVWTPATFSKRLEILSNHRLISAILEQSVHDVVPVFGAVEIWSV